MITANKIAQLSAPAPPLLPFEQAVEAVLSDLPHPLSVLSVTAATGEPIVGVRFRPGAIAYVVVDPRLVTEVLVARRRVFERDREFIRAFTPVLGTGLITDQTSEWARRRRQVQGALRRGSSRLEAITAESTAALVDNWSRGEVRDLGATVGALHWRILVRTVCGSAGDGLADPSPPARDDVGGWPNAGWRRIRSEVTSVPSCAGTIAGLLDQDAGDERSDQVTTLLFGGRDTTASAITWTLIALARHPEVQARLRDELHSAAAGGELTTGLLTELPYLRSVIAESLRLYPPTAFIARSPVMPVQLDRFTIPAGATLILSPWVTQRDPRNASDPLAFRPERWPGASATPQAGYFPFGAGPRMCVARQTALTEIAIVVGLAIARSRLTLIGPEPEPMLSPTLTPTAPVHVRLEHMSD
jgi:cytochrome P450